MSLEKAKRKYKLYKWLFIGIALLMFIMFSIIFTSTTGPIIFAFSFFPLLICLLIFKSKRKYYKQVVYDLSIKETAIKETINDKHLK